MAPADWLKQRVDALVERHLGPKLVRRCEALSTRRNEYGYDPFGFHPGSLKYPLVVARWLYRHYFRCETRGMENIPSDGPCLLVANHSGQLPFDALVILTAVMLEAPQPRVARTMVERFVPTLPFVSYLYPRWGQITGTPENCRRLLADDEMILVFPEGAAGISKPFSHRYQLQGFGHGFLRLALETGAPVVPIAVVGAEEQAPALNSKWLAKLAGTPAFPIVPYPPFVPIVPLPVKYRLLVGEPMYFEGDPDDEDELLAPRVRAVKNRIRTLMHQGLRERDHVFW
ncbi:lysophospholipid acyltransferase family protein [Haliangium ochraceum]|uniref:Phospholipid/glycerol acyltransferase n=1 Tax=Haliangium ochraceum (strain DSM 14365 / JCM 11303 / SMP-2) TaxID=502025 RepID=D0LXG7_HALO1|nr:lysophospholipid acyltransferase family protein [Haliangium ochraceum]ACY17722.1 phospholipid/glycerol acyltransferase [Haliangium ochraceum DSM 14365]